MPSGGDVVGADPAELLTLSGAALKARSELESVARAPGAIVGGPAMDRLLTRRGTFEPNALAAALAERARQLALAGSPAGTGRRLSQPRSRAQAPPRQAASTRTSRAPGPPSPAASSVVHTVSHLVPHVHFGPISVL